MQVVEIPKEPPVIGGGAAYYANGDELNLTCTSNPSYPPTTLTWYLNGNKVGSSKDDEALLKREDDLYITTSFLRTKVQNSLFRYGEIRVKCVAELTEEPIKARIQAPGDGFHLNILKLPEAMKLSTETIFDVPMFGAGRILSSWCFLCIFFSLIPLSV
ncbi:uncharacterized protein LOC111696780 [Eurytemora carolleeae]|uniref:uncharacterized protein LOC111696780 n=1 Tax=Eurytemora carolleeae TaxID=1294199 RepID=UPI000C7941E3|nr:uncharacterized protein LOC111696780 [Eurytemora carolleeae]|eukprot:XP_023322275.1 uncharacterized protein LOC111696780 [Eurytemora affinis]